MLKYLILIALVQYGLCISVKNVKQVVDVPEKVEAIPVVEKDVPVVEKDVPVVENPVVEGLEKTEDVVNEEKMEEVVKEVVEDIVQEMGQSEVEGVKEKVKFQEEAITPEEVESGYNPQLRDIAYACEANGERGFCQPSCSNGIVLSGGNCAQFGKVCCLNKYTCGNKTKDYYSAFTPGNNNLKTIQQCNLVVEAADNSICQIRVDFVQCLLSQPTQSSAAATAPYACVADALRISGTTHPVPDICGACSNQHFYLHINQTLGETSVNLNFFLSNRINSNNPNLVDNPYFDLRITQLSCPTKDNSVFGFNKYKCSQDDFYALAPPGCLQYFTERSGQFKSLTYDTTRALAANKLLGNLNYAVCFKKVPGAGCVKFTSSLFSLSVAAANAPCTDRITCTEMLSADNTFVANREACGTQFATTPEIFCPAENPFYLKVRTDNMLSGGNNPKENGFVINFENPPSGGCPVL